VTADHGKIFDRGKIWYGFHPDEEVVRVPLLILGLESGKQDDRYAETIDLTQTILERFGVTEKLSPNAFSILGPDPRKLLVSSITNACYSRKEQFLVVYRGNLKYVINIYPGVEQSFSKFRVHTSGVD